jgi:hypothetical protein
MVALSEMQMENCLACLLADPMAMQRVDQLECLKESNWVKSRVKMMASKRASLSALLKEMSSEHMKERHREHSNR